jgi:hypothetical protein
VSTVVKMDGYIDPPANPHKDGDYYDTCPQDGCLEVDALHRSEGDRPGVRESTHDWSIFNADARKGGCGFTWTRTTSTGERRDRALGREPRWKTRSAGAEKFLSAPSDQYRNNYDLIKWTSTTPTPTG